MSIALPARVAGADTAGVRVERWDAARGSWLVETANFRVRHPHNIELARRVAAAAERTRAALYRKWFGTPAASWSPRCEICLYANGPEYAHQTGVSASMPGYANVCEDSGRIVGRRIDLNAATADLLTAILPHEVAHIVLWSEFGRDGLPRWAHEGVAVLSEPCAQIDRHLRNLPAHRDAGELFALGDLLQLQGYPERQRFGPFYAQSVSLLEFLARRKGPAMVTRFLRDGRRDGYAAALQRHYGWTLAELEHHWQQQAFGPATRTAAVGSPGE